MRAPRPVVLAVPVALAVLTVGATPAAWAGPVSGRAAAPAVVTASGALASPGAAASARADNTPGAVAGYVGAIDHGARHTFAASFRVPSATCPAQPVDPVYVTVIQFGNAPGTGGIAYVDGEVAITCTGGVAAYQALVTSSSGQQSTPVSPGDQLSVKLASGSTTSSASLMDNATGAVLRSAGGGIEVTAQQASLQGGFSGSPFPDTAPVPFAGLRSDGAAFGSLSPTGYDQVDSNGTVVLHAGRLDRRGLSFVVFHPSAQ